MVQKNKNRKTPIQELSSDLAKELISKMVIDKGKICFVGNLDKPLQLMARGESGSRGLPPAHRWSGTEIQFQNPDGSWGQLVELKGCKGEIGIGREGKAGKDARAPVDGKDGRPGAAGDCVYPEIKWLGTSLKIGDLPPVNLIGRTGERGMTGTGSIGKTGPCGQSGRDAKPAIMPVEVIAMVSDIADLQKRIRKLEGKK